MLVLVLVLATLSAVVLVISSFLSAETCPYLNVPEGYKQSDYVLNSIIASHWPMELQDQILELPAPKNVLYGLNDKCVANGTKTPTLLPSIGIDKIANLTKIANGEAFENGMKELSA